MKKEELEQLKKVYENLIDEDVKEEFLEDLKELENEIKENTKIIDALKKAKSKDELATILSKFQ